MIAGWAPYRSASGTLVHALVGLSSARSISVVKNGYEPIAIDDDSIPCPREMQVFLPS